MINEKGKLIAQAFKWKADENLPDTVILRRLRAAGLNLYKQRLSEIFHNQFYCGKITSKLTGDKVIQGKHPAIVDEDTFNKVNGINTHSGYTQTIENPLIPLRMHIRCPVCGGHLSGYEAIRRKKRTGLWYYKCNKCRLSVSAIKAHAGFENLLKEYILPEEIKSMVAEQATKIYAEKCESDRMLMVDLGHLDIWGDGL